MTEGPEHTDVEQPFIYQLVRQGWSHLAEEADLKPTHPSVTERDSFHEVLLKTRLADAIKRINLNEDSDPWLTEEDVRQAISALERLPGNSLLEKNREATKLLLTGTTVQGPDGKQWTVRYIDWDDPDNNHYLVIDQFRVDGPGAHGGKGFIVPDIVCFINGIPVVVAECKSPGVAEQEGLGPIGQAIKQLRRYADQLERSEQAEGAEQLFHYSQFTVATSFDHAHVGTFTARAKHYMAWKDTYPYNAAELAKALRVEELSGQQKLVAVLLDRANLLDVLRNFTLFNEVDGRTVKIVARYQQWRAVHKAVVRLLTGKTRRASGEQDRRGGIVWHTQGSGKSLTMVFLIRKLRTLRELRRFKVVFVTDRTDLQDQLRETALLTGDPIENARNIEELKSFLRRDGPGVVFGMIQKFRGTIGEDEEAITEEAPTLGVLNESEDILVLVDEAHRSHTRGLHASLVEALPNCAKIGFTGTPILKVDKKRTTDIFGPYIDIYTIVQSQRDGSTVPILYEGRPAIVDIIDHEDMDALFDTEFSDLTPEEREEIRKKYAQKKDLFEATHVIAVKARDILRHYVTTHMPNRHKAQVVAVSRLAAVRYQDALEAARTGLIAELEERAPELEELHAKARQPGTEDIIEQQDEETQALARAYPSLDEIRTLEFATVISADHNDPPEWRKWSEKGGQKAHIKRFKRPLDEDSLCMLVVKGMLLTGFDAPVSGALYLDRGAREHELLQAIARVNRPYPRKEAGLVVDYYGIAQHLREALEIYTVEDLDGAWLSIKDELPRLRLRHQAVLDLLAEYGVPDIHDIDRALAAPRDARLRARFKAALKPFLATLDNLLPRPEALPYVRDARQLGYIQTRAQRRFRDERLAIADAGEKVQVIIDEYVRARGIDPKIPPVDILDAAFDAQVAGLGGAEAQAAEMEYAIRYHLRRHWDEDPVRYQKLSERLEEILAELAGDWEAFVKALEPVVAQIRQDARNPWPVPDPEVYAPFMSLIMDQLGEDECSAEDLQAIAEHTGAMVDHIRNEIARVDFWRNAEAQRTLRNWVFQYFDRHGVVPFDTAEELADRIVQLAKARHGRLVG